MSNVLILLDGVETDTNELSPMPMYMAMSQQDYLLSDCILNQSSTEMSPCMVNVEPLGTPKNTPKKTQKNTKKRKNSEDTVTQSDVLREQFVALKQKQENMELKKMKLQLEIFLLSRNLDAEEKENFSFLT